MTELKLVISVNRKLNAQQRLVLGQRVTVEMGLKVIKKLNNQTGPWSMV